ncbi:endonuclease/exonuclease/phosphatase family metal-dependent hydrolase [Streptosporangium becharense]|uniref:Endonuclease/exonuclease/phosphatase family metal-dependent hydrolase n=1 Tax=Streptosporangium becharense TaxID=1816182 RepID=A0A7W9IDD8_9ACTN|nr:endonuclease/exonuclease/phosphatase family protein [Streptosporangium becharense]MBB2911873.1 endonuclease/exonuclease/phosphatase family metal-dependent hydrolase [Streptosporangium becharense]MBB5818420.1 endonuclease/exonuclease/phosphatase family metal-dependent hydrolase [Streptosporangium becharense]
MVLRVASYNVRSMKDDVGALERVVAALRADVLCVQEAPRFLRWRRKRVRLAAFGGLSVVAGRRRGGVAVLAGPGVRVVHGEGHLLQPFLGLERRAIAIGVVESDGWRAAVGSVHLDLDETARVRHAAEALALLRATADRFDALPVLAGDINEQADQPGWRHLTERLTDCYPVSPRGAGLTFPARGPHLRIDAIFAAPDLSVVSCGDAGADPADLVAATDHLPVIAELTCADPGGIGGAGEAARDLGSGLGRHGAGENR